MLFYYDYTYWMMILPVLLITIYAQAKVSSNFNKYSRITNRRYLTGAQAAEAVLRQHGIYDVRIERVAGKLTDHYDPRTNVIRLSSSVYDSPTIAAVGVAAHEAGHAVQYAVGYGPIRLRSALIPVTQVGSQFGIVLLFLGIILSFEPLFLVGIVLFGATTVFQLVTLPVEYNASHRAIETIESGHLLDDEELVGAKRVLSAAALTYVAALLTSVVQLLRFILLFAGRNDRGGRR